MRVRDWLEAFTGPIMLLATCLILAGCDRCEAPPDKDKPAAEQVMINGVLYRKVAVNPDRDAEWFTASVVLTERANRVVHIRMSNSSPNSYLYWLSDKCDFRVGDKQATWEQVCWVVSQSRDAVGIDFRLSKTHYRTVTSLWLKEEAK